MLVQFWEQLPSARPGKCIKTVWKEFKKNASIVKSEINVEEENIIQDELVELNHNNPTETKKRKITIEDENDTEPHVAPANLLTCPLNNKPFEDPVFTSCGHTFDRTAIKSHLEKRLECPLCKESNIFVVTTN